MRSRLAAVAIVAATVFLSGVIMGLTRWQVAVTSFGYVGPDGLTHESTQIYRLNRWTGEIQYCVAQPAQGDKPPYDNRAFDVICPAPNPGTPPSQ